MKRVEQLMQCNHPSWFAILQKRIHQLTTSNWSHIKHCYLRSAEAEYLSYSAELLNKKIIEPVFHEDT